MAGRRNQPWPSIPAAKEYPGRRQANRQRRLRNNAIRLLAHYCRVAHVQLQADPASADEYANGSRCRVAHVQPTRTRSDWERHCRRMSQPRSDNTRPPAGPFEKPSLIWAATGRRRKSRLEASRSKVARLLAVPGIAVFRFALMIESACSPYCTYNGEADEYANAFVAELHVYNRLGRHPAETLSVIVEELRIQVPLTHAPAASFATAKLISGSV